MWFSVEIEIVSVLMHLIVLFRWRGMWFSVEIEIKRRSSSSMATVVLERDVVLG